MSRQVILLSDAQADLNASRRFHEEQEVGLGNHFIESLGADLRELCVLGGCHRRLHGYQRCVARKFPFAIFYRVENETVFVYAVLDCRRDPVEIRRRLRGK